MKNGTDFKDVGLMIFASEEHRHEARDQTPTVSTCSKRQIMNKKLPMTSREAHELCRLNSPIDGAKDKIQGRGGHYVETVTQAKHLKGHRKSVPRRRRQVRQRSVQDRGRLEVKRRRRQRHVGTTLRENEGVARGVADGQDLEEHMQDLPQGGLR